MLLYAQLKGSNLNESEGDNPKGKIENRISKSSGKCRKDETEKEARKATLSKSIKWTLRGTCGLTDKLFGTGH